MTDFVAVKRRASVRYGLGQPPAIADSGIPIIRATNIYRGRIREEGLVHAAKEDLPLHRTPLLTAGEVLVVRSGAYTGDSALVTSRWAESAPGYDLRLTPTDELAPRFLAYTMLGQRAADEMNLASMRAAQPHLNAEDLGRVSVRICSVEEQTRVADYLDAETARLDELIAEQTHLRSLLAEHVSAEIDSAIWDHFDDTIPLGRITAPSRPIMYGIVLPGPNVAEGVLIVKGGDVRPDRLRPEALCRTTHEIEAPYRRARLRTGDVIYSIRGSIGDAAAVPAGIDGANITQDVARISPAASVDSKWLLYAVSSRRFFAQLDADARGATIRGINIWSLKKARVPRAPQSEQERVVEWLDRLTGEANALDQELDLQIALLRERRQALITHAVTRGIQGLPGVA